ncbi:UNVERIFIED_CONTAM: hypothetical protein GTU68_022637 [Idotea baltica]|nr:hypothetical protein [Idotea baltica]
MQEKTEKMLPLLRMLSGNYVEITI